MKDLQGKMKKSPDDLKAQLKSFMAVSHMCPDGDRAVTLKVSCACYDMHTCAGSQTDTG